MDTSGLSASETFSVATPASAPVGISPMRASGFLSTLGVVTHIPYTDSAYVNLGNVVADLQYLGITQIRDFLSDGSNGGAPLSSDIYLAKQGIKFTTIVETSTTAGLNYTLSLIDQVNKAVPGSITAVEGPNEINNEPLTFKKRYTSMSIPILTCQAYRSIILPAMTSWASDQIRIRLQD
jgi:hypothetical protein